MYKTITGLVTGLVIGISFGATVVAPRLNSAITHAPEPSVRSSSSGTEPAQPNMRMTTASQDKNRSATALTPEELSGHKQKEKPDNKPLLLIQWNVAGIFSDNQPLHQQQAKLFETNIQTWSSGNLKLMLHRPGDLVTLGEEYSAVRSGSIEATYGYAGANRPESPALSLFSSFPFAPPALELLAWIKQGGGEKIYNELNHKAKVHGLICGIVPAQAGGWFSKRIETASSLRDIRISASGFAAKIYESLGAKITDIHANDLGKAFKSGLIDGAIFAEPTTDYQLGLNEFASNYYFPGWHNPATLLELLINLENWNNLSHAQRSALQASCNTTLQHGLSHSDALQFESLKKITNSGTEIQQWSTPLLDIFRDSWHQIANKLTTENSDFRKAWNSLKKFREEYSIWQELKNHTINP